MYMYRWEDFVPEGEDEKPVDKAGQV
jgi:hypothetical protein